jgi:hypothetical protein
VVVGARVYRRPGRRGEEPATFRWFIRPPGAVTRCSGRRHEPAGRPGRTCGHQRRGRPGWPSWRSSWTPTSSTPTGSQASRCVPCPVPAMRLLRPGRRRATGRRRGAQVADRPGVQPHRWQAPLRPGRSRRPPTRRSRRRGPLLPTVQTNLGTPGDSRRRPCRTTRALTHHPHCVLRDPPACRGMDLALPRRRPSMGRRRERRRAADRQHHRTSGTSGRVGRRPFGTRTHHRRSPRMGTAQRLHRLGSPSVPGRTTQYAPALAGDRPQ